jgi:hypothetical protein
MEQRPFSWTYFAGLLLFIVGIRVGISFPDIDLRVPFLLHRSLLTHGLLLPLLLFFFIQKHSHHALRWFAMGAYGALAIHLCFDLFPRSMRGFALISIPMYGRASALFSWLWIGLSCVVCLYLMALLIKYVFELFVSLIGLALTFVSTSAGERSVGLSLLALLLAICVAFALPSPAGMMLRQMKPKSH